MRAILTTFMLAAAGFTVASAGANGQTETRPTASPKGTWVFIGTTEAKHTDDHDIVMVRGPNNTFRQLKIKVAGASLHMQKLVVTYGNDLKDDVPVNYKIPKGTESRPIPMKYGRRKITQIDLWYDTKGWLNGSAKVSIYGMH